MRYILEHVCYNVRDIDAVVAWYREHLGLKMVKEVPETRAFLADASDRIVFEIVHKEDSPYMDGNSVPASSLHNAFVVEDVEKAMKDLVAAGAQVISEAQTTTSGDQQGMLVDPFGIGLQLVKRAKPMT